MPNINLKAGANRKSSIMYGQLVLFILILILFSHVFKLDSIPPGLYFDESSIGHDASSISQSGFGSAGVFFRSAADYDSPILVYSTAIMFKVFGISEYTLRLTNTLFFTAALILTALLATRVFKQSRTIWIYLIISFGFLPQFFTISRLSFEVISQLAFTAAACLGIWSTFHQDDPHEYIKASICGFVIGISTYTYSTASVLSALMFASLWGIYLRRENLKKLLYISGACLISLIPYAIFTITNPNALSSRFHQITYIYDPIPFIEKAKIFSSNYFAYWSPGFLLLHGDANLRHSTSQGGMIYVVVSVLFIVGLIGTLLGKYLDKFRLFLIFNLLVSPVAAALTSEGTPHQLRSLLLGYYLLLVSCYGLKYMLEIGNSWVRVPLIAGVFILLTYEVFNYQIDYFVHYPARSVDAFGSYDFKGSLGFAIEENPQKIILFNNFPGGTENLQFYSRIVDNPNHILIQESPVVTPESRICIIFRRSSGAEEVLNKYPIPYTEFRSRNRPAQLEKKLGAKDFSGVMRVRCYHDIN